jgi:hypothetical protein
MSSTRETKAEMTNPTSELPHGFERYESEFSHPRLVALPLLPDGTVLTLHTRNTCYRMLVVDGWARRVQITGGRMFADSTEAEVVGAKDEHGVRHGGTIVEGLQLELSTPHGPVITSMVESVAVHKGITAPTV